jgi:hypothetical protein
MDEAVGPTPNEFSCDCGARVSVDPMTKERRIPCPGCGKTLDFTVDFDLKKRSLRVSVVIPRGSGAQASSAKSPAKSSGRTIRGVVAQCPCGTSFPIDEQQKDEAQICPGCKCSYHVVVKTDPLSKKRVAILVPRKPLIHRDEIIRATVVRKAPDPAAQPSSALRSADLTRRNRTRIIVPKTPPAPVAPPPPPPPPEIPLGAQAAPCTCGATFIVRKKDLAGQMTCAHCGLVTGFQEIRDPQTLAPTIRIKPAPPK